jgi:hypothetical protein
MKGRSTRLLLIVRNGICVCGSIASTDEKVRDDGDDADMTLAGIGKLLAMDCGVARLSGTIEPLDSDIGKRIGSSTPTEVGATKEILSIEGLGESAPEPIPDPMVSVGIGIIPLVAIAITSLVSFAEVEAMAAEVGIDLLG